MFVIHGLKVARILQHYFYVSYGLGWVGLDLMTRDDTSAASVQLERIMDKHGTAPKTKHAPKPAPLPDTKAKQPDTRPRSTKK